MFFENLLTEVALFLLHIIGLHCNYYYSNILLKNEHLQQIIFKKYPYHLR